MITLKLIANVSVLAFLQAIVMAQQSSEIDVLLNSIPKIGRKQPANPTRQPQLQNLDVLSELSDDIATLSEAVATAKKKIPKTDSSSYLLLQARYIELSKDIVQFILQLQATDGAVKADRITLSDRAVAVEKHCDSLAQALAKVGVGNFAIRRLKAAMLMEVFELTKTSKGRSSTKNMTLALVSIKKALQFKEWDQL